MKALQIVRPRSFAVVVVPVPQLSSRSTDQLLIQTRRVSMCGSDIPFFTGSKRFKSYPLPPGVPIHECVGQVVESTSNLFRPGDHVIAIPDGNQGLAEFFVAPHACLAHRRNKGLEVKTLSGYKRDRLERLHFGSL